MTAEKTTFTYMKTIQLLFIIAVTLFSINTTTAQYGYGNGYGNGYGYGRDRSMSQMNQTTPDKPKEIPAEVTAAKAMEKLKSDLNLDALQEIAIHNLLVENIKSQTAIIKSESTSQADKIKEIQAMSEVTDRKIKEFLNEEQKVKYIALKEENKNPQKSKKSKKNK
jgi:hypothetical protein